MLDWAGVACGREGAEVEGPEAQRGIQWSIRAFCCDCRVSHPNIVALEDVHESPSHLYLAMEL